MGEKTSKVSRRTFLNVAAGAAGAAGSTLAAGKLAARTVSQGAQGANDRVRMALIGTGHRGRLVSGLWLNNLPDISYVAACDVYKMRLDQGIKELTDNQKGAKVDAYEDYRRILDRKDVDAVHIATPDHWHCKILIDAMAAGKDVYVEKPLSNTIERAVAGLKAYKASNRIVQFGTQQRSGTNWIEAAPIVQGGELGKVTHCILHMPGTGYGTPPEPVVPVPEGLNWDMFQGPAPRHPFKMGRLRWRGWWDYGGGLITDWGVHLTQVVLWYLNAQTTPPLLTSASSQYVNFVNPEHNQSPDAVMVTWQYPDFVMSFTNAVVYDWEFGRQGNLFFGPLGSLRIHRQGFEVRPPQPRRYRPGTGPKVAPKYAEARRVPWREPDGSNNDSFTIAHGANFLKSLKARSKPIVDLEEGFYASLPCILGIKAVREGKTFKWDDVNKVAVAV